MEFRGTYVALVTPFKNGLIDFEALSSHVERQISGGVTGLVPCGTTGESPTLNHEEHNLVVEKVVEMAAGRVPVIAGTGSNSTSEAIASTQTAEKAGAQAALVVSPYYNKPTQEGLYRHFKAIAECSSLPVMLYNIPGRCGVEIDLDTTQRLAELENVQCMKEATGSLTNISELKHKTGLAVLSGDDNITLPTLSLGGDGVVSVISNLYPDKMSKLVAAGLAGDFVGALAIHNEIFPAMMGMFLETNPIPVKTALAIKGLLKEEFRAPLCEMAPDNRARLVEILRGIE